jgi:hypothetical protein
MAAGSSICYRIDDDILLLLVMMMITRAALFLHKVPLKKGDYGPIPFPEVGVLHSLAS